MAYIIVSGNEKGGAGKTTSAMHLIISLLKLGFKVASIDIDYRQQSLTTYIQNRRHFIEHEKVNLLMPEHRVLEKSRDLSAAASDLQDESNFSSLLGSMHDKCHFIVIDTPGSDTFLGRLAHSYADTVMTPINDSFIDVDLIGKIDSNNLDVIKPGIYSASVWEQKIKKAAREKKQLDWVVMRNRTSPADSINKRNITSALEKLAKKFGFRIIPGFGDRVIFKELFLHGLTLNDAGTTPKVRFSSSIVVARQELRDFLTVLRLPDVGLNPPI